MQLTKKKKQNCRKQRKESLEYCFMRKKEHATMQDWLRNQGLAGCLTF